MTHTKGPWKVAYNGNSLLSIYSVPLIRMVVEAPINEETGCHYQHGSQEALDFEFIASAPDLLEALERMSQWFDVDGHATSVPPRVFVLGMREAIQKARGHD